MCVFVIILLSLFFCYTGIEYRHTDLAANYVSRKRGYASIVHSLGLWFHYDKDRAPPKQASMA